MSKETSLGRRDNEGENVDNIEIVDDDYEDLMKAEMRPPLPIPSGDISRPTVKVTPLVSYVKGEGSDSDTDESDKEEFDSSKLYQRSAQLYDASEASLSAAGSPTASVEEFENVAEDDATNMSVDLKQPASKQPEQAKLPPEPEGRCSRALQDKIARMLDKKHKGGISLNEHVQRKKDFRNPSIYEKLVGYCSIDEYGTNYPKNLFNPSSWGPESYYDALAKAQKEAHDKKEKEKHKKGQVEFIKATKKLPTSAVAAQLSDEKQKISKWDTRPSDISKTLEVPIKKPKPNS
eukprot:gene7861-8711_t